MIHGRRWLNCRRWLDAVVVFVASPILLPVAAVAMLAVFLEDRDTPLIRLGRVGRFGSDLAVAKIRSMRVGGGPEITASADNRITRVGSLLRSFRIDEIPQTLQVLTGEMALIGPRPEAHRFVEESDELWHLVLQARPAIAGMSQVVAGTWEATQLNVADPESKYRAVALPAKLLIDAWYVENASPVIDLQIIISVFQMLVLRQAATVIHATVEREVPQALLLLAAVEGEQG